MSTMSRDEALLACQNIIDLAEDLANRHGKFPAEFGAGITERTTSIQETLENREVVTEKQDTALRNMWAGLKKWTRFGGPFHPVDLFEGLEHITPKKERVIDEGIADEMPDVTPAVNLLKIAAICDELLKIMGVNEDAKRLVTKKLLGTSEAKRDMGHGGISKVVLARTKEAELATTYNQAHERGIRVVPPEVIRSGDVTRIVNETSSDRTKQLIYAAFYAGKIVGLRSYYEELQKEE